MSQMSKMGAVAMLTGIVLFSSVALTQNKGQDYYKATFFLSGVLLRASVVCNNNNYAKTGIDMIATQDTKDIFRSFPKTTKRWGYEGANYFNDRVMNVGLDISCAKASEWNAAIENDLNRPPPTTDPSYQRSPATPPNTSTRACQLFPNLC